MGEPASKSPGWRRTIVAFLSGALFVVLLLVVAYFGIRWFDTGGQLPRRQVRTEAELAARLAADMKADENENRSDIAHQIRTLYTRRKRKPDPTLDFLLISGGGDRGAFGAGFLLGWSSVKGPNAMPELDGVSGVSAGALLSPFAFLETRADFETIDRLFSDPKPDWMVPRGIFFFLPENASFNDVPGLVRDVRSHVDLKFAERIVQASSDGQRVLIVQATDVDSGAPRAFDVVAVAREAVASRNPKRLSDVLLASSAIPGAFPPREIDGRLYADGAIVSNFYYGGKAAETETFGAAWKREHPDTPIPKTRYWVIINDYIEPNPITIQPTWPAIVERAIFVAVRSAEAIALRHLYEIAEATRLRGEGDVEVRWVAVPQSWRPPNDRPFDKETMRLLSAEGKRLGADPNAWMTQAP